MKWRRRIIQILVFLLFVFLFLQTTYRGEDVLYYPVNLFLRVDPLIAISTMIAARKIISGFLGAGLILLATLFLGRFFCGWICPLGTFFDIVSKIFFRNKRSISKEGKLYRWDAPYGASRWKYYLLFFLLTSSILTLQLIFVFDPISLITRSFTVNIYPAFNFLLNRFNVFPAVVKKQIFSLNQPVFLFNAFIFILFLGIVLTEGLGRRFWCRNLCPLGAMFGLVSKFSFFRRIAGKGCNDCLLCQKECKMKAVSDEPKINSASECIACLTCADVCPKQEIGFEFQLGRRTNSRLDLSRRQILISIFGGILAVPVIKNISLSKEIFLKAENDFLIRPPGSLHEEEFLKRCIRCGECMRVCVGNALHPSLFESGIEGLWSPMLVPRLGYCEYNCTLCGQVCPTQAIKELTKHEKHKIKIGLAHFDKNRCIPWARQTNCIVCEEHCPVSPKAIVFEEGKELDKQGNLVKLPRVIEERCIGCGICQNKCPVQGKGAVIVTREKGLLSKIGLY